MQPLFARLELPSADNRTSQNLDNNGIQEQRSISIKQTNVTQTDTEEVPEELETMSVGKTLTIEAGQYHEINPGQDLETNPGQDLDTKYSKYHVDNYKVDLDLKENAKVYNIEAKVGGFIVGETGRIDQGQTSEGVRWTIREGAIDDHILASLLGHFGFGKRISRTARPDRLR